MIGAQHPLVSSAGLRVLATGGNAVDAAVAAAEVAEAVELELRMWVDGPRRTPDQVDPTVRERVREMDAALFAAPDEGEPEALDPPAVDRLGEVRAPTLVVTGDLDDPNIVRAGAALAAGIPGAARAVLAGTAHLPNLERPRAFNRRVLAFLDRP